MNPSYDGLSDRRAPAPPLQQPHLSKTHLEPVDRAHVAAFQFSLDRTERWKGTSPTLVQKIQYAINTMAFSQTDSRFAPISQYSLPPGYEREHPGLKIETALLYQAHYGAILSIPVWNRLDTETQAGLIIHEALRQIQGAYQYPDFKNDQLQRLTASLLDKTPVGGETLESKEFLGERLLRQIEFQSPTLAPIQVTLIRALACQELSRWRTLASSQSSCPTGVFAGGDRLEQINRFARTTQSTLNAESSEAGFNEALLLKFRDLSCSSDRTPNTPDWLDRFRDQLQLCLTADGPTAEQKKLCNSILIELNEERKIKTSMAGNAGEFYKLLDSTVNSHQRERADRIQNGSQHSEVLLNPSKAGSQDIENAAKEYSKLWSELQELGILESK